MWARPTGNSERERKKKTLKKDLRGGRENEKTLTGSEVERGGPIADRGKRTWEVIKKHPCTTPRSEP